MNPLETVVGPVNVFVPDSSRTPVPALVIPPGVAPSPTLALMVSRPAPVPQGPG